jgi:hypothetical protein
MSDPSIPQESVFQLSHHDTELIRSFCETVLDYEKPIASAGLGVLALEEATEDGGPSVARFSLIQYRNASKSSRKPLDYTDGLDIISPIITDELLDDVDEREVSEQEVMQEPAFVVKPRADSQSTAFNAVKATRVAGSWEVRIPRSVVKQASLIVFGDSTESEALTDMKNQKQAAFKMVSFLIDRADEKREVEAEVEEAKQASIEKWTEHWGDEVPELMDIPSNTES